MSQLYDSQKVGFFSDLRGCISMPTAWLHLSLNDIRSRYRRTRLGPWWIVIGMAITLGLMSSLWSVIFGLDWRHYLPYMIIGIVTWTWLSGYIVGACDLFSTEFSGFIRAMPTPPLIYVLRVVMRGFLLQLHYMTIPLITLWITGTTPSWSVLFWLPASCLIILINAFFLSISLGFLCARIRDISQLVKAVMPPLLLLTPAIWHPAQLGPYIYIAEFNPFTHFLEIIRAPLLGQNVGISSIAMVLGITAMNMFLGISVYKRYRNSLVFWL